jgi:hypothetical protein
MSMSINIYIYIIKKKATLEMFRLKGAFCVKLLYIFRVHLYAWYTI